MRRVAVCLLVCSLALAAWWTATPPTTIDMAGLPTEAIEHTRAISGWRPFSSRRRKNNA